ncbi:FAD-dependent oxidoreductase [Sphingomonas sp.]|uniref:NAD(P)/FAD-dependent oxidoreductase n=1 Tax=Sphingomonas sp. TaxID=28214 RepID=UPI0025D2404C|nr:FAD-dependent oxidoreductase [Sphingomonas sp.]
MDRFDIVIVGGGIAGASLGAEVARVRRTLLIEAEEHPGMHSTGRSAAFWLESYGGAGVAPLSTASHDFLSRPPADFADEGFLSPRGAVHVDQSGRADAFAGIAAVVKTVPMSRAELEAAVPGIDSRWVQARAEPGCADIDVAGLHAAYLRQFRRRGGVVRTNARMVAAIWSGDSWRVRLEDGGEIEAAILVDAAGAWADQVAEIAGVAPIGIAPKRRTMVQLRVGRSGIARLPQVIDAGGSFYFKGEGERSVWISPHDEIASGPCDAQPEEIDIAVAIDRFERAVDWPVEAVERSWAGLRSFAPDRLPVFGFDIAVPGFFWFAGQGGFGIQTAPAAAKLAAAVLLAEAPDPMVAKIDPAAYSPARFSPR